MIQFLRMGGYAVYLWPAYGVTLLAVVLNILWARALLARASDRRAAPPDARRRDSMTPKRRQRLTWSWASSTGVGSPPPWRCRRSAQNVTFYFIPTQVAAGPCTAMSSFRLGGMVSKGSVQRAARQPAGALCADRLQA